MFAFKKVFASVFLAVLCAGSASAVPFPASSKFATHRTREISRDFKLETYHPESSYETFGAGVDHPLSKRADASIEDSAVAFIQSRISGLAADAITVKSSHESDAAGHVYVKQTLAGIPFANAVANVAFNKEGKVVAFGSSFVSTPSSFAKISTEPSVPAADAISSAEDALSGAFNAEEFPEPTLEWFAKDDGSIVLTHVFQVRNEEAGTWYEAFVDAHSGDLVSVTDFVAKASYRVLPITKEVLTEGLELVTDPQDTSASPNGWHTGTDTQGNNAIAYKSSQSQTTSQSGSGLVFDYAVSTSSQPTTTGNVNAARVNAFYIVNSVHDMTYKYGFTEAAYNFQADNLGKGGKAGDRVTVSVQDSAGTNNADFSTPPDGQSGAMRMFTWTYTSPRRDGALENDIVIHENTHGVSNRLTSTEAGGMGEGWSDSMADWFHKTSSSVPDFVMGQYVIDDSAGIRNYPYSTSASTNPLRYSSIKTLNEVHNIGEVWANLLHNVYAALVAAHGFSAAARTDPSGSAGNVVFMHLFIDQLALQPCNPTFVTARDAWIQADANRYAGANKCTLWKAFASKGLGTKAASYNDDSTLPSGC
ncbi:Fungalysin metallopeptidase-domain-containing protein [Epithele typhae]|uniref:Fungalysin metallopeptidase-domain-containing protein n=1 Tax=Epithele typhae TaxID=378194 RepID=UPI00200892E9|nr:Fungalysin metallopeptidase-domain-containing protein [Epithele typhae]KAH9930441.1 Fungalysin metallopeptidase-domain-containing protein [Epithele typhae]